MEDLLSQVNAVAGTIGSMVYDDQGRLVAHQFPKIFDRAVLDGVMTTVSGNLPGLEDITGGVKMVDFRFQNGLAVVRPVDGGGLVVLCEGTTNLQALNIALNLVIKKIERSLKEAPAPSSPQPAAPAAPAAPPASPQELIDKGILSPTLQGMQTILAKYVGPMAKIIFLECVETWMKGCPPVKANLPHLVDIVAAEIGDPAKVADYRQKISAIL